MRCLHRGDLNINYSTQRGIFNLLAVMIDGGAFFFAYELVKQLPVIMTRPREPIELWQTGAIICLTFASMLSLEHQRWRIKTWAEPV